MNPRLFRLAASLTAAITFLITPAHAAPLVGPGSGLRMLPDQPETTIVIQDKTYHLSEEFSAWTCSQGPSGTVLTGTGERIPVMLTAGHCISELDSSDDPLRPEVYVNLSTEGYRRVGMRDKVGRINLDDKNTPLHLLPNDLLNSHDWGTVRLDPGVTASRSATSRDQFGGRESHPVAMTGIKDYRTLGPTEVSVDNFGQPICKDGILSARSCGTQLARTRYGVWSWGLTYEKGDSGGNNYDPRTGEIIGVTSMGLGPLGRAQPADVILEEAYGVPDGRVNEHFALPEDTTPAAPQKSLADEQRALQTELEGQGLEIPELPDFRKEFNDELGRAHGTAEQTAAGLAQAASASDVDAAARTLQEAHDKAAAHADRLGAYGLGIVISEIAGV